jgi:hypothetical protein
VAAAAFVEGLGSDYPDAYDRKAARAMTQRACRRISMKQMDKDRAKAETESEAIKQSILRFLLRGQFHDLPTMMAMMNIMAGMIARFIEIGIPGTKEEFVERHMD